MTPDKNTWYDFNNNTKMIKLCSISMTNKSTSSKIAILEQLYNGEYTIPLMNKQPLESSNTKHNSISDCKKKEKTG